MKASEIYKSQQRSPFGIIPGNRHEAILVEIALQLARLNEHNERMEKRYFALTAAAVKRGSKQSARLGRGSRQKSKKNS